MPMHGLRVALRDRRFGKTVDVAGEVCRIAAQDSNEDVWMKTHTIVVLTLAVLLVGFVGGCSGPTPLPAELPAGPCTDGSCGPAPGGSAPLGGDWDPVLGSGGFGSTDPAAAADWMNAADAAPQP
jgi:hypothetical protein